jgi:hypothetical protein
VSDKSVWSSDANVMSSHIKNLVNHLLLCLFQSEETKNRVSAHKEKYSDSAKSPGCQRPLPPLPYNLGVPGPSSLISDQPLPFQGSNSFLLAAGSSFLSRAPPASSSISLNSPTIPHSQLPRMDQPRFHPYLQDAYSHSGIPSSDITSSLSLHPSESASQTLSL